MSLVSLRDAIKDALEDSIKEFAKVYVHGGRFDLDELKRFALQAPCAVIAPLGVRVITMEAGQPVADTIWGVYLLAKDTAEMKRDVASLALLEATMSVINPLQRFGETAAHAPDNVRADNLYSGTLDKTGTSIWAVTWTQGYDINEFDISSLDDFLRYRSTTSLEGSLENTETVEDAVDLEAM